MNYTTVSSYWLTWVTESSKLGTDGANDVAGSAEMLTAVESVAHINSK